MKCFVPIHASHTHLQYHQTSVVHLAIVPETSAEHCIPKFCKYTVERNRFFKLFELELQIDSITSWNGREKGYRLIKLNLVEFVCRSIWERKLRTCHCFLKIKFKKWRRETRMEFYILFKLIQSFWTKLLHKLYQLFQFLCKFQKLCGSFENLKALGIETSYSSFMKTV